MNVCPLCEQDINREDILNRLAKRLAILTSLSQKAQEVRRESSASIDVLNRIIENIKSIISEMTTILEFREESKKLSEQIKLLTDFINDLNTAKDLKGKIPLQHFTSQKDTINTTLKNISAKSVSILKKIQVTEKDKKALEILSLIERVKGYYNEIIKISPKLEASKKYASITNRIYNTFTTVKKGKIQEIYNSIQGDIQGFYSILHPGEPHSNIELTIERRASTGLTIDSFGKTKEDPRALSSEGHLDSLGLCIFLAFVKKFNQGCSLMILDDVVTTIDAKHRGNICKILFEEFSDKQLIITTHDAVWYRELRNYQQAYNMSSNFKNIDIVNWDVTKGIEIRPYKPQWEKIQDKISSGDKNGAGNDGRIYLEWVLEQLCLNTQAVLVFKDYQRYMVNELFEPARQKIDKLLKDGDF